MAEHMIPDSQSFAESQPFSQTQRVTQTQTQPVRSQAERPRAPPTWGTLIPISAPDAPFSLPKFDLLRPANGGKSSYTIGRASKGKNIADLQIDVRKVSGIHARIYLEDSAPGQGMRSGSADGDVVLEDLSTNGTFVHGIKIDKGKRRVIQSGDEITICPATGSSEDLKYIFHATPIGYVAPRPDPNVAGGLYVHYDVLEEIGEWVAIKIMNKRRFSNQPKTFIMLEREVELLKQIDHPHVIGFKNYFADDDYMFIVLEYVNGGDVLDSVMKRGGLPESEAAEIARQVCSAVAHLHTLGIAHRDLKPDNLLLTKGENPICKVTDFGLAKMADAVTMLKTLCGTPNYLAPECAVLCLRRLTAHRVILQPLKRGYDFAVDAWSIGVIVCPSALSFSLTHADSALANALPFEEDENEPLNKRMAVRRPDMVLLRQMNVSEAGLDFIAQLLVHDPAKRMTVAAALKHPWLQAATDRASSSGNMSMLIAAPPNKLDENVSAADSTTALDGAAAATEGSESNSYSQKLALLGLGASSQNVRSVATTAPPTDSGHAMDVDSAGILAPATPDHQEAAVVPNEYVSVAGVKRKPKSAFSSDEEDEMEGSRQSESGSPATSVAPSVRKGRTTRSKPKPALSDADELAEDAMDTTTPGRRKTTTTTSQESATRRSIRNRKAARLS